MPSIVGVDPGVTGGLFCMDLTGEPIRQSDMPVVKEGKRNKLDVKAFTEFLRLCDPALVLVERQHVFGRGKPIKMVLSEAGRIADRASMMKYLWANLSRGDSALTAFGVGRMYGMIEATIVALGIRLDTVPAPTWQKVLFKTVMGESKENALAFAVKRWPMHDFRRSQRCKVAHDGIVDAACIAEYGRVTIL